MSNESKMNILGDKEIICTLGPSSLNDETIVRLEELGVSLFRINLSHTKVNDLVDTIRFIQGITTVPICLDTEGAQIRTGELLNGDILLQDGDVIQILYDRVAGNKNQINLYPEWVISKVEVGDLIKVDSEDVIWQVISKDADYISVRVLVGGLIGQNKAVTVDRDIVLPPVTDKDRECLQIGVDLGIRDFAISFVNRSADLDLVREIVGQESQITSKIECINGVKHFDSIAANSDRLLIDRGDLSRQVLIEKIPQLQKHLIQRATHLGIKIYVATNLLESMVNTPMPTRAEVNDIYNTLRDGAAGLVLAAETAIGAHPKLCVEMVSRVIQQYLNNSIDLSSDSYWSAQASAMLIEPHGGKLVDRLNNGLDIDSIVTNTIEIDYSIMSSVEQIAIGTFSPVEGFMNKEEIDTVLEQYRMPTGVIWPLPIIFQVGAEDLRGLQIGDVIGLTLHQTDDVYAVLYLEDIFTYDLDELALKTCGTKNFEHPGVKLLNSRGEYFLAGKIDLVKRLPSRHRHHDLTPLQARSVFGRKGWSRVVGFHTRNVIHRVHEHIQMHALDEYKCDGIFLHPVVGRKKKGDYSAEIIMKSYEFMMGRHYPKNKVLLSTFSNYSRYSGPREAVFSALCRKNFGCSHFIVGRDHTGVGDYYDPDESRKLFESLGDIGITPIFFDEVSYCSLCKKYVEQCKHNDENIFDISGTEARDIFQAGNVPPDWFMRSDISNLVLEEINNGSEVFVE